MTENSRYLVPADDIEVVTEIKRSRFIARIGHCQNTDSAFDFIKQVKARYPDARHHCWAFIACPPNSASAVRCADDGEPSGTAGKPILNVLSHSHYGEIVCVVSRYFGGIKLGAGGLVRAYSNSSQAALEQLSVKEKIHLLPLKLQFPYPYEAAMRHYLEDKQMIIEQVVYSEQVIFQLAIEDGMIETIIKQGNNLCRGELMLLTTDEPEK